MKKGIAILLSFVLLSAMLLSAPAMAASDELTGAAHGNNGPVTATVTLEGDRIVSVEIDGQWETPGIGLPALQTIAEAIVAQQSLDVDAVAGATVSSRAAVQAVENALLSAGIDTAPYPTAAPEGERLEKSADIVVVGGGLAGMVSTVRAAENGAHVILVERSEILGGNARFAMGWISGAGFRIQKELGVEDSPELFYQDIVRIAGGEENLYIPTARYYAEHSGAAIDWLQDKGVEFKNELNPGIYDPMSVLRVAWGSRMGASLVSGMQGQIDQLVEEGSVEVLFGANAEELIVTDGAVTGVKALQKNGDTVVITAKATILAAGGYEASEEKLSGMFENVARSFMTASKGDTVDLAVQAGAATHDMESNTVVGGVLPTDGFYSNVIMDTTYGSLIFVDVNGNRVFNEMGAKTLEKSQAWVNAPENTLYAIVTSEMLDEAQPILSQGNAWMAVKDKDWVLWDRLLEEGELIIKVDTLEELAERLDMPELKATVDTYNTNASADTDPDFGRTEKLQPLDQGPFYAIKTIPYCSWSTGGPMANENMEVLNEAGETIPGLYVAGEGAGHALVAGKTPISGMYLGMDATFGIDAADHAAAYALNG